MLGPDGEYGGQARFDPFMDPEYLESRGQAVDEGSDGQRKDDGHGGRNMTSSHRSGSGQSGRREGSERR